MNFPVWDVWFGAGLLVAVVSITHVFVSHFAVGGGLFLVLTESKAYRENDPALLNWLKIHTKFFVLVTVVFGAVSGVGIWFTIGLVNPSATSSLIHSYVWGWAIEWVFFFLEISAALFYLYGWDKLDRRTHLWYGWIYFIAAFASMVIINGIITFMLTPGKWIQNHEFWTGFFNPSYFPSLFIRFAFALALAGMYALVTASLLRDRELKSRIVKWSIRWAVPSFLVMPLFAWWYVRTVPAKLLASAEGGMPTATRYASIIGVAALTTLVLLVLTLFRPARMRLAFSLVVLASAFSTMWAFEFIREAVRKPYVISDYMYDNSLYARPSPGDAGFTLENVNQNGILKTARWIGQRELTAQNQVAVGREIFRVECQSCHTADSYRGIGAYLRLRQWSPSLTHQMLTSLDVMHNGVMPPFAGIPEERQALAAYVVTLGPSSTSPVPKDGKTVYERNCSPCHEFSPNNSLFTGLRGLDQQTATAVLEGLHDLNSKMPDFQLSLEERNALSKWINQQFPNK